MRRLRELILRAAGLFNKQRKDRELEEEIESHLQMHVDDNIRQGMTPGEARRQALIKLGGLESTKEAYRDQRGLPALETAWQDIRHCARMLRRNPGFTTTVVLTLALGIGANATIFSVISAVLLEPLPYADPARLVVLKETRSVAGGPSGRRVRVPGSASFFDWRNQVPSLEQVAAIMPLELTYAGGPEPEQIGAGGVSANFLPMLGVVPMLGRNFQPEEEKPNAAKVVLLGHGFWQREFGGNPAVIGQALTLDDRPYTIIGILPATFEGVGLAGLVKNGRPDLWTPMTLVEGTAARTGPVFEVFARLKPGATLKTAQAEIDAIMLRLEKQFPQTNTGVGGGIVLLADSVVGEVQSTLWLLLGAVFVVLLIACSNVANLLFARTTLRSAEIATRAALGASRSRLLRQFFVESLILSLIGCVAGLFLAWVGLQTITSILPVNVPRMDTVAIDSRVLAFTLFISLLTGLIFGLAPAWQGAQNDLNATLKDAGRSNPGGVGRTRLRNALVVTQVALSLVLLMAAGVLLKSFVALRSVDPGFEPHNVLSLRVNLSRQKYDTSQKQSAYYESLLAELQSLPGVESAAAVFPMPFSSSLFNQPLRVPGRPVDPAERLFAQCNMVSPDYFRALRIRLTQGRAFTERDRNGSPGVIIVNETLARRMWPNEVPLGKRLGVGSGGEEREVVGVFADIKQQHLDSQPRLQICLPALQQPMRSMVVAVRGRSAVTTLLPAIRQRIAALDANVPFSDVQLLEDRVAGSIHRQRFAMLLLALFAGTALVLAVVGLYGVMSYLVVQRTREFGIRLALGAKLRDMLKLVVGHGLKLVLGGLLLGAAGSIALRKVLDGMLFNVQATDPLTFVMVGTLLAAVGAIACYVPARRAAKVDPIEALRNP